MDKQKGNTYNKRMSFYSLLSNLSFKTELAAAFAIAVTTFVVNAFIDLLGFVYWYSFFDRYSIPLKYIKEAVYFNSNAKTYILLLVPIICIIITLYTMIKRPFIRTDFGQKPNWLSTRKDKTWNIGVFAIRLIRVELFLVVVFGVVIISAYHLLNAIENAASIDIDDRVLFIVVGSLIFLLIRKDCVKQFYLRRVIKDMTAKSKINILVFLLSTAFFSMMIIVALYGTLVHDLLPTSRPANQSYKFFIEPESVDSDWAEADSTNLKELYSGTLDIILFETSDYYYTVKADVKMDRYDERELLLNGYRTTTYSLREKKNVSVNKYLVYDYTVHENASWQLRVLWIVSIYYVLFAISAIYNFVECMINL